MICDPGLSRFSKLNCGEARLLADSRVRGERRIKKRARGAAGSALCYEHGSESLGSLGPEKIRERKIFRRGP